MAKGERRNRPQMPTNPGNCLKMPESGFERWRPYKFFKGLNADGSAKTVEGFKNTLTDKEFTPPEGWNADLSHLDHGDLACVQHAGDAYRKHYDEINWDGGKV